MRELVEQNASTDLADSRPPVTFAIEVADETFAFQRLRFDDPIVTAAQIAERFGAHPLDQFKVLQQLASGETETKRPTETTDLREPGRERFFIVRSDRTFGFTVDGLSLEWPLATIRGDYLRELAGAREDQDLVRVTRDGFEPIDDEETVSFADSGTEEFRLEQRPSMVTVFYREEPFEFDRRAWTTDELMQRFGVPAGYKLDLILPNGEFKELKPGKQIKLREGMEFTSHVPAGQSS